MKKRILILLFLASAFSIHAQMDDIDLMVQQRDSLLKANTNEGKQLTESVLQSATTTLKNYIGKDSKENSTKKNSTAKGLEDGFRTDVDYSSIYIVDSNTMYQVTITIGIEKITLPQQKKDNLSFQKELFKKDMEEYLKNKQSSN